MRASLQLQCACFLKRAASPSAPRPAAALFNRIVGQQVAIVFDYPGVTRDRWAVGLRRAVLCYATSCPIRLLLPGCTPILSQLLCSSNSCPALSCLPQDVRMLFQQACYAVLSSCPFSACRRLYTRAFWGDREFLLVDTGGLMSDAEKLPKEQQARAFSVLCFFSACNAGKLLKEQQARSAVLCCTVFPFLHVATGASTMLLVCVWYRAPQALQAGRTRQRFY